MKLPSPSAFALVIATLTTFVVAGTAHADYPPLTLTVQPSSVAVGDAVYLVVTGCPQRQGPGAYQEPGLADKTVQFLPDNKNNDWYANATAGDKPGVYTLTVGCPGFTEHATAQLTITAASARFTASPDPVVAGQPLHFDYSPCVGSISLIHTPAVAGGTLVLHPSGVGSQVADVLAGDEPGKYRIHATCLGAFDSSETVEVTVLARSTQPPPTTSAPTPVRPTTPQVPVVPKGAPQTGGGGLAAEVSAEPMIR